MNASDARREHGDDEVSRAYAAAQFAEEPPEHVDRAVLAHARSVRGRRRADGALPWPELVGAAAAIVLAVAVVVEVGRSPVPPPAAAGDESAPRAAARASVPAQRPAGNGAGSAAFESRQTEAAAGDSGVDAQTLSRDAAGAEREALSAERPAPGCNAAEQSSPETWVECMLRLARDGRSGALQSELRAFERRHPDRALPEELAPR